MDHSKYRKFPAVDLKDRRWPCAVIENAPVWCSVDLRDGNQALPVPMNSAKKLIFLDLLKRMGFKEIEVGFPSASETEYGFIRKIIDDGIAKGITLQVLTQAREHLIQKTFESLKGADKAIVHLYNSTSVLQRRVVFNMTRKEIKAIAVLGAKLVRDMGTGAGIKELSYEYSPESFTGTELEYALEVCEAVIDEFKPEKNRKLIINLPATVEMSTPNVYADQIEWFDRHLKNRDCVTLSVHAHNDRGTGVAATELAMLAGAERVEGTLFGNGERTGNADIITIAMNLYSQGIDPGLDISDMDGIIRVYEQCTGLTVGERHPYAGQLVYTAFSGSHQDAISKGLKSHEKENAGFWEVPYLPIDPKDLGRKYEAVIRINSQSGKGGVAFVLENEFGLLLPKEMHPEFGKIIKAQTDEYGRELSPSEIYEKFDETYFKALYPYKLVKYKTDSSEDEVNITASILSGDKEVIFSGKGNGPISAFFDGLKSIGLTDYTFETYKEHALTSGADAEAVAYIELKKYGKEAFGVGRDKNTTSASLKAVLSAINRLEAMNGQNN
jgi:2-isopropylmalate synthase